MAEVTENVGTGEPEGPHYPTVYTTAFKPTLFMRICAVILISCPLSVIVACTIWLCAWILRAVPVAQ